jgi:hypothetical protein
MCTVLKSYTGGMRFGMSYFACEALRCMSA